jgi:beta-barrel assembly-enhancing protease
MGRVFVQFILLAALLFGAWFGLSKVNWVGVFGVKKITESTEEKVGDLIWEFFNKSEKEIKDKEIVAKVDSILSQICKKNKIDRKKIKFHVLKKDEVNAFALPANRLIIFSGLIDACENEEELAGVMGHELAHIEKQHVMKKLVKEIGLSVLVSMSTGGGGDAVREAARLLSSSAFDRNLEREADRTSVDYLVNAEIDPEPFANFLYRLSTEGPSLPKQLSWLNTHPDSEERAKLIIEYIGEREIEKNKVLYEGSWENLKRQLKELE